MSLTYPLDTVSGWADDIGRFAGFGIYSGSEL